MTINEALKYPDASWAYFRCLDRSELMRMDKMLVEARHPLAFEAGSQWDRFRQLHAAGYQFEVPIDYAQ